MRRILLVSWRLRQQILLDRGYCCCWRCCWRDWVAGFLGGEELEGLNIASAMISDIVMGVYLFVVVVADVLGKLKEG